MITTTVANVSHHQTIYQREIGLWIPKRMVRSRARGQPVASSIHQAFHRQFRHQPLQNPRRTRLGLHRQKVPSSHYPVDNTIMTSYSKASVIHSLSPMYWWAGEFLSPNKWSGGHWLSLCPPLTYTSVLCCSRSTAKKSLICAMSERSFTWAEREMKYSENATQSLTLKTSDFIQLIQVHLNYSHFFLCIFLMQMQSSSKLQ